MISDVVVQPEAEFGHDFFATNRGGYCVRAFGSSVSGLGGPDSDVDALVTLPGGAHPPALQQSGQVAAEVSGLGKILDNCSSFSGGVVSSGDAEVLKLVAEHVPAKVVPLVRLSIFGEGKQYKFDLSFDNPFALKNTIWLRDQVKNSHPLFRALALRVKSWAKEIGYHGTYVVPDSSSTPQTGPGPCPTSVTAKPAPFGPAPGGRASAFAGLSSYAWNLLVSFFLFLTTHPDRDQNIRDNYSGFQNYCSPGRWRPTRFDPSEHLFLTFRRFYANFPWHSHAVRFPGASVEFQYDQESRKYTINKAVVASVPFHVLFGTEHGMNPDHDFIEQLRQTYPPSSREGSFRQRTPWIPKPYLLDPFVVDRYYHQNNLLRYFASNFALTKVVQEAGDQNPKEFRYRFLATDDIAAEFGRLFALPEKMMPPPMMPQPVVERTWEGFPPNPMMGTSSPMGGPPRMGTSTPMYGGPPLMGGPPGASFPPMMGGGPPLSGAMMSQQMMQDEDVRQKKLAAYNTNLAEILHAQSHRMMCAAEYKAAESKRLFSAATASIRRLKRRMDAVAAEKSECLLRSAQQLAEQQTELSFNGHSQLAVRHSQTWRDAIHRQITSTRPGPSTGTEQDREAQASIQQMMQDEDMRHKKLAAYNTNLAQILMAQSLHMRRAAEYKRRMDAEAAEKSLLEELQSRRGSGAATSEQSVTGSDELAGSEVAGSSSSVNGSSAESVHSRGAPPRSVVRWKLQNQRVEEPKISQPSSTTSSAQHPGGESVVAHDVPPGLPGTSSSSPVDAAAPGPTGHEPYDPRHFLHAGGCGGPGLGPAFPTTGMAGESFLGGPSVCYAPAGDSREAQWAECFLRSAQQLAEQQAVSLRRQPPLCPAAPAAFSPAAPAAPPSRPPLCPLFARRRPLCPPPSRPPLCPAAPAAFSPNGH